MANDSIPFADQAAYRLPMAGATSEVEVRLDAALDGGQPSAGAVHWHRLVLGAGAGP